jgi:hypothetical protein
VDCTTAFFLLYAGADWIAGVLGYSDILPMKNNLSVSNNVTSLDSL